MTAKKTNILTSKQQKVYDFICGFLTEQKKSPTIFEIAAFLNVSSLRTVGQYLEALERKKLIYRARYQKRGITLICENTFSGVVAIPVLSSAGCDNMEIFAEQNFDEFITIDADFLGGRDPKKTFAFKAVGDSMIGGGIDTGDLVLSERTNDIQEKDKVVAVVDGMAVIKQISFSKNAVLLKPMSDDAKYHPIIMRRNFQVFGKVFEVIKQSIKKEEVICEKI